MATLPKLSRLLVFRIGQIGDTVAALPSLWVLRQHHPEAHIIMLSEEPAYSHHLPPETVLPRTGLIDEFVKYPGASSWRAVLASWRILIRLRASGYSTLVYLAPSLRSPRQRKRDRLFFRLCGINHFLADKGFPEDPYPRTGDGRLDTLPKEATLLLSRLALDGFTAPSSDNGSMDLQLTTEERTKAQSWWQAQQGPQLAPKGWFALCPGAKWSSKRWPWERYLEVGRRLMTDHGLLPVVVGGVEDREIAGRLITGWGTGLCAAGELSVRESAALMEGARFYLGNDTGAMHLAAAVGRPCVGIFSAQDWPGKWSPYGSGHEVLRFEVPCAGCRLEICNRQLECLNGIETNQVYEACVRVLHKSGEKSL